MENRDSIVMRIVLKYKFRLIAFLAIVLLWMFCLPKHLFKDPVSTVVSSADHVLIGARVAEDGQYRFPEMDSIPTRYEQCVLLFEDEHFYKHPGFNPVSILKAIKHNLTKKSRRGGSTITQQLVRLSRKNKKRTYWEKGIELFMATRLEFKYSKKEILTLYASHTPYGGNVVGLETASWRYFGIPAHELSWGQSASLAVLPNAPSLIFPGKNEGALRAKRNRLLKKLYSREIIDETTYELAIAEPLPQKPLPLPNIAPHLTERIKMEHPGTHVQTSLDRHLQIQVNRLARQHSQRLKGNEIHNLAVLVLDVETRKVLAYVGNAPTSVEHGNSVDIITKNRSTGSTLKPFLFTSMLHEGDLLPHSLVKDVPTVINGYHPENFNKKHSGAVPASLALSRSLNVPAVRLLQQFGLQKFYNKLQKMGLQSLTKPAEHYGLPLILGGAESSLWQVTNAYAATASTLNHYVSNSSTYRPYEFTEARYATNENIDFGESQFEAPLFNAGAVYHTFKSLRDVNRPNGDENWEFFDSSQPIAWKTGTSFGFKDAWAVGVTPKYAIGVWVGNADGEGRPGLTGITAAAPLFFEVLGQLPPSGWFLEPYDDLAALETCKDSGFVASVYCSEVEETLLPEQGERTAVCPYHQRIFLDANATYRVNSSCYPLKDIVPKNWFKLPPIVEYFYANTNPNYEPLPPYLEGCQGGELAKMEFIHPRSNEEILLPKDFGSIAQEVIFKLAHQQKDSTVHWYLDETYVSSTSDFHEIVLPLGEGSYLLTAVDHTGNRIQQNVKVKIASEN
ncbi:penicillin-binding protein 1C [Flagellimonas myxillae]|uniref:penicillin-binding protein 1C n=1 Tax=Flagellimonas myxillae TaxID=2942214 RepID=UPI00201F565B|nr:penicillin-binding protein 1C [Muricauda myxillae]MCL6267791.1 penicillin-binding protein 1C [Muricauda myxillae]